VLTDGQTQVRPLVSPECFAHLHPQASLHGVLLVRKYTIRYTSYGPPRDKLQFILETVDWLGHGRIDVPQPESGPLRSLQSEALVDILRQLHDTRMREDRRCLSANTRIKEEADEMPPVMDGTDNISGNASQSHTQHPFGTQLPSPARARPAEDGPQFLGVRTLEPVLAGNTQREDIRPRTITTPSQLLDLLARGAGSVNRKPTKASLNNALPASAKEPRESAGQPPTQLYTQLPVHMHRQPTQSQSTSKVAALSPSQPPRSTKQVREIESVSPRAEKDPRKGGDLAATAQQSERNVVQKLASECSWMKDFEFTREAFRVPYQQMSLLQHDDSWHKSMPGRTFPSGNVPIGILTTLHRTADEKAAMEAGPDSDDEMDEDPSPESPVEAIDPSPELVLVSTQEEQCPSSPAVSWSSSPGPEPPQMLSRLKQGLPPDSSFEAAESGANSSLDETTAPPRSQNPIPVYSNEPEQNDPPSSPPLAKQPITLEEDMEMEMEEHVPQGLGEDSIGGADDLRTQRVLSASPPRPVVQVKEMPHVKSKNCQHKAQVASSPGRQTSSGTLKHTSSASTVYGTYNDKSSSDLQTNASRLEISEPIATDQQEGESLDLREQQRSVTRDKNSEVLGGNDVDVSMFATMDPQELVVSSQQEHVHTELPLTWNTSLQDIKQYPVTSAMPVSTQLPSTSPESFMAATSTHTDGQPQDPQVQRKKVLSRSPSTAPGATKRKHENSPSKKSGRHSKRREIKLIDFGSGSPRPAQTTSALRSYREESLRKFRESRKSGTGFEDRSEPAGKTKALQGQDAMQVDSPVVSRNDAPAATMSPQHESLYDDPNPGMPALTSASPSRSASQTSSDAQAHLIPEPKSLAHEQRDDQPQPATTKHSGKSLNVFETFKEAYPKYTGDTKHFQSQCMQMIKLDQEDKMVPKWQWDDFIIRNRTDYKEYALECVDRGEDPEPYHRFYKDTIRDTIYRRGIIEGRSTLLQALQQFNVQPPTTGAQTSSKSVLGRGKRPRKSLPSAFSNSKAPSKSQSNTTSTNRPRHSLPAPLYNHQTPVKDNHTTKLHVSTPQSLGHGALKGRSTPQSNPITRLQLDGAAPLDNSSKGNATAGTGDPYRDYYFAALRATSLTGSTKVSSTDELSKAPKS
jgi:hypothetical protein